MEKNRGKTLLGTKPSGKNNAQQCESSKFSLQLSRIHLEEVSGGVCIHVIEKLYNYTRQQYHQKDLHSETSYDGEVVTRLNVHSLTPIFL